MPNPVQQNSISFKLILGMLMGLAAGQIAMADSEQPAVTQVAPSSTQEAATVQASTATALTGPQVYNNVCIACHSPPGVGGAPALGDNEAWAARITQGMDTLIEHALTGFTGNTGVMPKKGERIDLSDEEVIRAVKYMVDKAVQ